MARRMVRARRASPYQLYLLIAFVVLSVGLGVGLAWTWSVMNQHMVYTFGPRRLERAADTSQDLWADLLAQYGAPDAAVEDVNGDGTDLADALEAKQNLADGYAFEIRRLTERLMGDPFSTQKAQQLRQSVSDVVQVSNDVIRQCSEALAKSYQMVGDQGPAVELTSAQAALRAAMQRLDALVLHVQQDFQAKEELTGQIKGLQGELVVAKEQHAQQVAQLEQNLNDERTRQIEARDRAVQQSGQFNEDAQRVRDQLVQERKQWKADKAALDQDMMVLKNNLADLQAIVNKFREVPSETTVDGRIVQVAELGSVVYADIGKQDGILLGWSFSILSPAELGKAEPMRKAAARVVRILDDTTELRVVSEKGEPIVVGDVLYNPVYDRQRRLRFMLVGTMDMDGDGQDDSGSLRAMIQELGGRPETELSVQTDYLVLGDEPKLGPAPGPDAGPMERQMYEEARTAFIAYTGAVDKAQGFSIPVLSLNRFLGLMGLAGKD